MNKRSSKGKLSSRDSRAGSMFVFRRVDVRYPSLAHPSFGPARLLTARSAARATVKLAVVIPREPPST